MTDNQYQSYKKAFSFKTYLNNIKEMPGIYPPSWERWWAFKKTIGIDRNIYEHSDLYEYLELCEQGERPLPQNLQEWSDKPPSMEAFSNYVFISHALNGRKAEFKHRVTLRSASWREHDIKMLKCDLLDWGHTWCNGPWRVDEFAGEFRFSFALAEDAMAFKLSRSEPTLSYERISDYQHLL